MILTSLIKRVNWPTRTRIILPAPVSIIGRVKIAESGPLRGSSLKLNHLIIRLTNFDHIPIHAILIGSFRIKKRNPFHPFARIAKNHFFQLFLARKFGTRIDTHTLPRVIYTFLSHRCRREKTQYDDKKSCQKFWKIFHIYLLEIQI